MQDSKYQKLLLVRYNLILIVFYYWYNKLLLLLFQPLGIPALQPSQSTTPYTVHQQQLTDTSFVTSLLSPPLGLSFSQVQQPSSLAAHISQKTKPPICEV